MPQNYCLLTRREPGAHWVLDYDNSIRDFQLWDILKQFKLNHSIRYYEGEKLVKALKWRSLEGNDALLTSTDYAFIDVYQWLYFNGAHDLRNRLLDCHLRYTSNIDRKENLMIAYDQAAREC